MFWAVAIDGRIYPAAPNLEQNARPQSTKAKSPPCLSEERRDKDGAPANEITVKGSATLQQMLGGHGSFCATLRRDGLSHFAYEEGLQVGFRSSRLQTDNGVSGLARNEIALTVGAGYFKLADLALQSLGNVIGRNAVIQFHGDFLQRITSCGQAVP